MRLVVSLVATLGITGLSLPAPALAAEDVEMIVDGTLAPEGKYPYQVRLYDSFEDDKGGCGGSLIDAQWVLTAAHCMYRGRSDTKTALMPSEVVIGYGSNDREATTKIAVSEIYVHPKYAACDGDTNCANAAKADIALLKLDNTIPEPKVVGLADPDTEGTLLAPGAKVVATGWGAMWDPYDEDVVRLLESFTAHAREKMSYPRKLHEVQVDWVDNETCAAAFDAAGGDIAETEICAMRRGTRKDSCQGDSGGPLVVPTADGTAFTQVGVVSWGRGCGASLPGVYTRVAAFSDWINETVKGH